MKVTVINRTTERGFRIETRKNLRESLIVGRVYFCNLHSFKIFHHNDIWVNQFRIIRVWFRYFHRFIVLPAVIVNRNIREFFTKANLVVERYNILKNQVFHIKCSQIRKIFREFRKYDKIIHWRIEVITDVFTKILDDNTLACAVYGAVRVRVCVCVCVCACACAWWILRRQYTRPKYQRHQTRFYRAIVIFNAKTTVRTTFTRSRL